MRDQYLQNGGLLPSWFAQPEIIEILSETYPPRHKQGVRIWFTGLSGAGKSTTAEVLTVLLQENGRQVTVLDGDVVRTHLSRGLGFSKEDRTTRNDVRNMVGPDRFIEVFVDTPLAECERRDTKGIYAKARRGEIKNFTGIDDIYEQPRHPEITITTMDRTGAENADLILEYLMDRDFVRSK